MTFTLQKLGLINFFSLYANKISDPILLPVETKFKQAKSPNVNIPLDTWG
jgi:hypothetical protein